MQPLKAYVPKPGRYQFFNKHLKIIKFMMPQFFIQVSEEMVALLAFIGFYIFGVCCYKVCTGFLESPSNERKKPNTNTESFRIKTKIVTDKMDYLAVWAINYNFINHKIHSSANTWS